MKETLNMLEFLLKRAVAQGATAADVLLVKSAELSASRRRRQPEGLERAENQGLGLRVFKGHKSASVSTTDTRMPALEEALDRALMIANAATEDADSELAARELLAKKIPELDLYDRNEPSVEWMHEQCTLAEDAALAVNGVTNSQGAEAHYGSHEVYLAAAGEKGLNFAHSWQSSSLSISVTALAGSGVKMERDYDFSSARHRTDLADAAGLGKSAGEKAVQRLGSRKCPTGSFPVMFDPRAARNLLGAFAGAINGSAIARGTSFLKDAMDTQIFSSAIRIIDDPHRVRGLASKPFDGEGVANSKRALVASGNLQSWLLDTRTANKLGLTSTGHASRSLSSSPSPSPTNLYIDAGAISPEQMMRDMGTGFFVTDLFGTGINLVTGDYSQGASGFWVENGQITYATSEVTIAGRLQDMFLSLTAANDLDFIYGINTPSLRVERMTVAGA